MESNIQDQPQQFKPTGAATSTARATSDGGQTVTDKVSDAAHAAREQVEDNVVSNFSATRGRRSRMVEPVMRAASTLARELFR